MGAPRSAAAVRGVSLLRTVGIIAFLLIALLRRIQQEREFSRSTAMLLRLLTLTVITGVMAVTFLNSIASAQIVEAALSQAKRSVTLTLLSAPQVVACMSSLVLAALAEVIARGEKLSEDVEGLV